MSSWKFSEEQMALLREYIRGNQTLIDCLTNSHLLSQALKEEIEENLLLPIAEIEKRKKQSSD